MGGRQGIPLYAAHQHVKSTREDGVAPTAALSQTEMVVGGIKSMITSGKLSAGSRLPVEKDLATELRVSRGSLREGVQALRLMGVLEARRGDGTYVTSLEPSLLLAPLGYLVELHSDSDLRHLQAIRRVLETEAAATAAKYIGDESLREAEAILSSVEGLVSPISNMDHQSFWEADLAFHRVIAQASDNPPLEALIEALLSQTGTHPTWESGDAESMVVAHIEHRGILSSLASHDPEAARLRMSTHLLATREYARDQRQLLGSDDEKL